MPATDSAASMSAPAPPISVRTQPGWNAAHSARPASAIDASFITELTAALDARYVQPAVPLRSPIEPMRDETTPMRAPGAPPAGGASASATEGSTRIAPSTLACITASKSSTDGGSRPAVRGP